MHATAPSLPHNLDAEQFLLGAMMCDSGALDTALGLLRPDFFYDPVHRRLYEIMIEMTEKGLLIDPVTVRNAALAEGILSEIGGEKYLAELASSPPVLSHVKDYARAILATAQRRQLFWAAEELQRRALNETFDWDVARSLDQAIDRLADVSGSSAEADQARSLAEAAQEALADAERSYKAGAPEIGVSTGFPILDRTIGGLGKGRLITVAARPGLGKTAIALQIAISVARQAGPTLIFSLEMKGKELALRAMSAALEIEAGRIARLSGGAHTYDAAARWIGQNEQLPLFIDQKARASHARIMTQCRLFARSKPAALIVVDYIQLVRGDRARGETRAEEIARVTGSLKEIAGQIDCPIIACSQLNRDAKGRADKRPELSDLRDSGAIEQDSDQVLFLHREDRARAATELIVGKNRHGPEGTIMMEFDGWATRFRELPVGTEQSAA